MPLKEENKTFKCRHCRIELAKIENGWLVVRDFRVTGNFRVSCWKCGDKTFFCSPKEKAQILQLEAA